MNKRFQLDKHFWFNRVYDLIVSISYAWSVYQLCIYMAKTYETHGTVLFIPLIFVIFTLLIRSFIGVVVMNAIVFFACPSIFYNPVIARTGDLFFVAPCFMMCIQVLITIAQVGVFAILLRRCHKLVDRNWSVVLFAVVAVMVAVAFTLYVTVVPTGPLPYPSA